jgi:hypothetical protein
VHDQDHSPEIDHRRILSDTLQRCVAQAAVRHAKPTRLSLQRVEREERSRWRWLAGDEEKGRDDD